MTRMLAQRLGLSAIVLLGVSGAASAQTQDFKGSDTLEIVVRNAIPACEAAGCCVAPPTLNYLGGGSGTAETAMTAIPATQAIGPMSRNFKQAVMTAHPSWVPTARNVLGLDAAVIVTKNTTGRCKNLTLPTTFFASEQTTKANANNAALSPSYDQILEVILSGKDGSGTAAACADPARVQAIIDFAGCQGAAAIDHILRRDDNSGTTNTFQDKIQVGRFCNGRAIGTLGNGPKRCFVDPKTTCTVDADCGASGPCAAIPNLNNQDLDPIRRACPAREVIPGTSILRPPTRCTNLATGAFCTAAENLPGCAASNSCSCTQGLVVALSQGDDAISLPDITESIRSRVAANQGGTVIGYAGKEAIKSGFGTNAPYVNNFTYSDISVRGDLYLLSRRLYVNFAPDLGATFPQQQNLFDWMTDPDGTHSCDGSVGRDNMASIVTGAGFITCGGTGLCFKTPFPAAPSTLSNCLPNGQGSEAGAADAKTSWDFASFTSTASGTCCSTGASVAIGGTCGTYKTGRPSGAACYSNADCSSSVCTDLAGAGELQCQ